MKYLLLLLLPTVALAGDSSDIGSGLAIMLLVGYFIPAIVAHSREHKNRTAITWLNVLAGWTLLGWLVAFIWSLSND